jgi:hypothetical protein
VQTSSVQEGRKLLLPGILGEEAVPFRYVTSPVELVEFLPKKFHLTFHLKWNLYSMACFILDPFMVESAYPQ